MLRALWPVFFLLFDFVQSSCKTGSFVIQRHFVAPGVFITSTPVGSLKQCSDGCLQVDTCSGFNFIVDATGQPHCIQVDGSKQASQAEKLLPAGVLYAGSKLCIQESAPAKSFSFEKWPQRTLKNNQSVIQTQNGVSLEECLQMCQKREGCRSAVYRNNKLECILSTIGINSVYNTRASFEYDESADIYENNAQGTDISRFDTQCSWMRLKSAGLPSFFDSQEPSEDVDECERLCVNRDKSGDICRSYTFDSKTKKCLMSLASARLTGKSPLENHEERFTHGDLDDCTDFSLHCQETGLELRGSSIRQFSGSVKTKNGKQVICNKPINSSFDFKVKVGFDECGLIRKETPFPSYSGVIHIKEGSTPLVTIRDKVLQVQCRMHGQMDETDQILAVEMKVEDGNRTDRILSDRVIMVPSKSPPLPKYTLKVLGADGNPSDVMRVGDHGWVQIVMNKKEIGSSFSVSKLEARDLKSGANITLLDEDGCVSNRNAIERIDRVSPYEIRFKINYSVFSHEAEIVYYAFAEPCASNCDLKCNFDLMEESKELLSSNSISMTRTRRSITVRQMELVQDVYTVHGSRVILLPRISKEILRAQIEKSKDVTAAKVLPPTWQSAFTHCVFDDATCLFSFALASLQFCLVVLCFLVMYCYVQQYRRYRTLSEESESPSTSSERVSMKPENE